MTGVQTCALPICDNDSKDCNPEWSCSNWGECLARYSLSDVLLGRIVKEGQIVGIDIGVGKNGYISDAANTYAVGEISFEKKKLLEITKNSLYAGIEKAILGNRVHDISSAVQEMVESAGFSVVRDLTGHGVGREVHEEPEVPNFGVPNTGRRLLVGMVIAIEPMVNMGGYEVQTADNGWTIETIDGQPSAHFEHTVAIVDGDADILTK